MANSFIQVPPDSTGKKLDTEQLTVSAQTVERERMQIAGATDVAISVVTNATPGGADYGLVVRPLLTPVSDNGSTLSVDDGAGSLTVDGSVSITGAIPAGTNNIGDVDILSGPTGASALQGQGSSASGAAKAGNPHQTGGVFNTTQPTVTTGQTVETQMTARGAQIVATGVDAFVLGAGTNNIGDVDVLTLPALPAGTNNIGDVDVLTLPALPAGTNNIGDVDVLTLPATPSGANKIGSVNKELEPALSGVVTAVKFASVSASGAGDNVIVAAVTSKKIRVLSAALVATAANSVTWRNGTTPVSGAMPFAANGGYSASCENGMFETAVTTALNLNLSAASLVAGHITYIEV